MAQTGYTPILIYSSSTTTNAPAAGSLTNSTLGSELAINITDGKLFYKDNANAVQVIAWKVTPTTAGGTGLTSYTQGDLLYYNSGTTLDKLAKNTTATRYLSNTGTNNNPAWAQVDLTNGVTGDLPYSNLAQGSALSVLGVTGNATADVASIAAGTDHQVLRRSGTSLAFGAVALNQSAAVTGTLPTGNGGTGLTSFTSGGVVYASSTSALTTGSGILFDGSNLLVGPTTAGAGSPVTSIISSTWMKAPRVATNSTYNDTFSFTWSSTATNVGQYGISGFAAQTGSQLLGVMLSGYEGLAFATNSAEQARIDTSGNLTLKSGNLVIGTSGKGIDFSVTSSGTGTMTSELLADYEEGTFTPTITGTTTAGTGTYTSGQRIGRYTKIGNRVYFNLWVRWTAHTGTGNFTVTGLPFTSSNADNGGNYHSVTVGYAEDITLTASRYLAALISPNATEVTPRQLVVGGGSPSLVPIPSAAIIGLSGFYEV